MTFQMDGKFPVLPCALAGTQEKVELLQLMIREFMALHYQLACGKDSPTTPWRAIAKHQSTLWDSGMWPSGVVVQDPSRIVLGDCQKIVTLWRHRQAEGGATHTFKFNFYIHSEGLRPAVYTSFTPAALDTDTLMPPQVLTEDTVVSSPQVAGSTPPTSPPLHMALVPLHDDFGGHDVHGTDELRRRRPLQTPSEGGDVDLPTARQSRDGTEGADTEVHSPEQPESDPPVEKGKQRKKHSTPSPGEESSDVTTDPDGSKSRRTKQRTLQRSLANISPEPTHDKDDSLPARLGKKSGRKLARKATQKSAPPASGYHIDDAGGDISEDTPVVEDTRGISGQSSSVLPGELQRNLDNGVDTQRVDQPSRIEHREDGLNESVAAGGAAEYLIRPKPKPKPKAIKKATAAILFQDETQAEEREREDNLFIVRKSARMHKPKYNIAPPAQLRLEKEREAHRQKGNKQ